MVKFFRMDFAGERYTEKQALISQRAVLRRVYELKNNVSEKENVQETNFRPSKVFFFYAFEPYV